MKNIVELSTILKALRNILVVTMHLPNTTTQNNGMCNFVFSITICSK